jgi:hypothetical protein
LLARDATRPAQCEPSADDRCSVAFRRIGPGDREVVLIAPLVAAFNADVHTAGRRVVNADRERGRGSEIARGLLSLQEKLLGSFEEALCFDRDLTRSVRARDAVSEEVLVRGGERARPQVRADGSHRGATYRVDLLHADVVAGVVIEQLLATDPLATSEWCVVKHIHRWRRHVGDSDGRF